MRVAPGMQLFPEPEIFVADIEPADPSRFAVHHHDLAMVTKIQLPKIRRSVSSIKRMNLHAGGAQLFLVTRRQMLAPDFIEEQGDAHAFPSFGHERLLKLPAQLVVAQNIELDQQVTLR